MSNIRELAKHDYHKEQDVQPSCTRRSVSRPKNDKNLIQEAHGKYFNYYVLEGWLLIL